VHVKAVEEKEKERKKERGRKKKRKRERKKERKRMYVHHVGEKMLVLPSKVAIMRLLSCPYRCLQCF
jgi:hypothetical protein